MVTPTIINGNSSLRLNPDDRKNAIVAGRLSFLNHDLAQKQVIVSQAGADQINLGSGELEIELRPGKNGKTLVTYYQDPNDHQAPLKNLTLVLKADDNSNPQKIELKFDPSLRIADDSASNKLKHKISPNSFQTEVTIPPGIYSVRAIEANTKEPEQPKIIAFKAPNSSDALRPIAEMLSLTDNGVAKKAA